MHIDPLTLADDALLDGLRELTSRCNTVTAQLLAYLGEVDARKLYLAQACPSLFVYCVRVLHMSEPAAYKRIRAARAARCHPSLLPHVASGELHLSALALLAAHLTEANCEELASLAIHKSKREVEKLIAERFPLPDAAAFVRKLPVPQPAPLAVPTPGLPLLQMPAADAPATEKAPEPVKEVRPVIAPIAPERFKVQFTASRALHDKLRQAQELLRHQVPDGDLAEICDRALTVLLEQLMRSRFGSRRMPGQASEPPAPSTSRRSRRIPNAVRRAVVDRDGLQCAFVSASGERCPERSFLELHHVQPFGRGGEHSAGNLMVLCRAHNQYLAEMDYGREHMARILELAPGETVDAAAAVDERRGLPVPAACAE